MHKINAFFILIFIGVILFSCIKDDSKNFNCTPRTIAQDTALMKKYAQDSAIHYGADSSRILYEIIEEGTGPQPSANSQVDVYYMCRLLSGIGIDSTANEPASFVLHDVIPGFQEAILKIKEGGHIKAIIPSSLAYGCNAYAGVAANQSLFFDIRLQKVNN